MQEVGRSRRSVLRTLGVSIAGITAGCGGGGSSTTTVGPTTIDGKILAPDGNDGDGFGMAVSIDGARAAIGAGTKEGPNGAFRRAGAVYTLERGEQGWRTTATVRPARTPEGGVFGTGLALDGERLVVGVPNEGGHPSAKVFRRTSNGWIQVNRIEPPDGGHVFGADVALSDGVALIGDHLASPSESLSGDGSATLVELGADENVTHIEKFTSDGEGRRFGSSVVVGSDRLFVGAPKDGTGCVSVVSRTEGSWRQAKRLSPSGDDGKFGAALAITEDRLFVGEPGGAGSVSVFERTDGTWARTATVSPNDDAVSGFGHEVAADDGTLLVSTREEPTGEETVRNGGVHVFERAGDTWERQARYVPGDGQSSDRFGWALAVENDHALIGAQLDHNDNGRRAGAVYPVEL